MRYQVMHDPLHRYRPYGHTPVIDNRQMPITTLEHPADCVGDAGAASGALMLALGALGLHDGDVAGPCLIWCASDGPERAAATLHVVS